MKLLWAAASLAFGGLVAQSAASATFTGKIMGDDGKPVAGAMVTLNDEKKGVAESVFSDAAGAFRLSTALSGELNLRIRKFYYADLDRPVSLSADATVKGDFTLNTLKTAEAISDDLPAAYHFGEIAFEPGTKLSQGKFQTDCTTCHELGNAFTRWPRSLDDWTALVRRMHGKMLNKDEALIKHRAELIAAAFNGKPISVRPVFPYDPALARAKIVEYRLDKADGPHDAAVSPIDGLVYTVDQSGDQIEVTDLKAGTTEYIHQPHDGMMPGGKFAELGMRAAEGDHYRGPHSLSFGKDGRWYVTDSTAAAIGVFNPKTKAWDKSFVIPGKNTLYPHTIRTDHAGIVWFTIGTNQIGRLDPTTGNVTVIQLAETQTTGMSPSAPYGIDINPKDGSVWFMRLFGDKIGRVDAKTFTVQEWASPIEGPRRGHFDSEGHLWVTGYSNGDIARIEPDGANGFKSEVIKMPEFAKNMRPAPYALGIDPKTGDIWVNETQTEHTYRYIPSQKHWIAYPMPLHGTYTRDVTFTKEGYACMSNNPAPNAALEGGVTELICIHPEGDLKVEARAD